MYEKLTKLPNFTRDICPKNYQNARLFMIHARKVNKIPEFHSIFGRNARILHNNYPKNFFFDFFLGGGAVTPSPVSYVYAGNARLPTVVRENDGYR